MKGTLYSKVLVNLINPINALSGTPVYLTLEDSKFRKLWAMCMEEGLAVYQKAGITPAKIKINPYLFPRLLRLPTPIWVCLQKLLSKVDKEAKSSMLQDMEKGKLTEIEAINGEIVKLAEEFELDAPINRKVIQLIHEVEQERQKMEEYDGYSSKVVYQRLGM